MAVMTTLNLDDMNNSNQRNSDWIADCISGLNSLPFSKAVEYGKGKNELAKDDYYNKNTSLEVIRQTGVDLIKHFKHQLTGCLGQSDSISGYELEALEIIYQLENPVEIFSYLHDKSKFVTFLLKAAEKINEAFADNMELTLVKKSDPEIADFDYLAVYINTSELSVAEARAKFKKFKYNWYFDHSDDLDGRIVFHVT